MYQLILSLLACHYVFDFVFQSHTMASNKSSSNYYLLLHVAVYSIWALPIFGFPMWFHPWIFATHFVTDYASSRMTSKLWKDAAWHDFFVTVGGDQFLHYAAIFGGLHMAGWL